MRHQRLFAISILSVVLTVAFLAARASTAQAQGPDCSQYLRAGPVDLLVADAAERCMRGGGLAQQPDAADVAAPDGLQLPTDFALGVSGANALYRIPLNNPAGSVNLGAISGVTGFTNVADFYQRDLTKFYLVNATGGLQVVDVASRVATVVGSTGMSQPLGGAYDPVGDGWYALNNFANPATLYQIDLASGAGTVIGPSAMTNAIGLGCDNTGQLYAYTVNLTQALLYQIDKTTGTATQVGSGLGFAANFGQGMDFDPSDNSCYLFATTSGAAFQLRLCDTTTGQSTLIGTLPTQFGTGMVELPSGGGAQAGPPTVDPNAQLWKQVHLPILNFQGQDDVCRTWIEVQVVGPEFSKAVLVTWGEPGFCPPQCAGPLKVECTGLLKPGSTWNFLGAQIPTGSKSGMLFKFTTKQLSVVAPDLVPPDDIVADYMCETLFFGVVGDCDDYRRFKKAYNEGLEFAGLSMSAAAGDGILAVDILRACPGDVTPGVEVTSKYNGIAGDHLGRFDPVFGGYGFFVPLLYADKAGFNSIMYIQNGGLECSSIELWFKAQDDCLRSKICEVLTLAPGETYQFDASDCAGPDWQGSAWIRSTQPLGIVVDIIGRDVLMTYIGEPAAFNYVNDPKDDPATLLYRPGNQVAFGPLIYSEYQGWDTGVQVQNMSPVVNAKVKVYFLDRSGDVITTLVDWICPRGSQTFFLPVVSDLPGSWVGNIRVESQEWWTPGSPAVKPPDVVGVATLIKYNDAARTLATEAIAYNLLPEHKAYLWQIGYKTGLYSGVGLIAIPSLLKDLDGTGVTSELAITNLVPKPGFTDFAIYLYDQNGVLDYVCQKLNEKQVEYINLQTWGYVNPGFKGSAIISAVFWEHDVFGPTGEFLRNLVGLGAVAIERSGTRLGEDVPGDEAAGERGIPFAQAEGFEFDFAGPNLPTCPGLPGRTEGCPKSVTLNCVGCPTAYGENITSSPLTLRAPAKCVVADVNITMNIDSQYFNDMTVNLQAPGGTGALFSDICNFGAQAINATLDDDAAASVTTACGQNPITGVYKTESGTGLNNLDNTPAAGVWKLAITDAFPGFGDLQSIRSFSIVVQTKLPD